MSQAGGFAVGSVKNDQLIGRFKEMMRATAQLEPAEYAKLVEGLTRAIIMAEGAGEKHEQGFDKNFHDQLDERGGKGHWSFKSALTRVLNAGTPAQLAAIGGFDATERQTLSRLGSFTIGGEEVVATEFVDRNRALAADNAFPAGSVEHAIYNLYQKVTERGQGKEDLLYAFSTVAPFSLCRK